MFSSFLTCYSIYLIDLEAEILCETAMQADNSHSARDLLMMSLSLCPDFVPSLLALANMELQALEGKAGHNVSIEDDDERSQYGKIGREKHNKKDKDVSVNRTEFSFGEVLGPSLCVDSQAYGFAMAAVRARELSPECWHALGRVYQAFGMTLEAAEAFSTALEYIKHSPIRPFSTVLADTFIKPADERKKGRI